MTRRLNAWLTIGGTSTDFPPLRGSKPAREPGVMELPDSFPPAGLSDLRELTPLAGWFGILRALAGAGSEDRVAYGLQANCIRLCEAAITEYQLAVGAVESFHRHLGSVTPLHWIIVALGHFESTLWNLERFIKHARALRSLRSAEMDLKNLIPRNLKFFQQSAEHRLTQMRHQIAHLESDIQDFQFPEGESMMLRPMKDGLRLGAEFISWPELEGWLREGYDVSSKLAEFKVSEE